VHEFALAARCRRGAVAVLLLAFLAGDLAAFALAGKVACSHCERGDSCPVRRPAEVEQPACHGDGDHAPAAHQPPASASCSIGGRCGHSHAPFTLHREPPAVLAPGLAHQVPDLFSSLILPGDGVLSKLAEDPDSPPPRLLPSA
jgi:hypothetical protein